MTGPTFATHAPPPAAPPKAPRPTQKPGERPDDAAGARVLVYLKLHWLMILFCGTLIGAAGAALAWELLASKYESYGQFQVAMAPTQIVNQDARQQARTDFSTYVKTQITLLKSEFVLNAALREIKDLPTIKAQKEPIKYLDEELMVSWQDGSEVIRVTFKSHEPEDARKIVNAVQKAFIEQVVERKARENREVLAKMEEAQSRMKTLLDGQVPARGPKAGAGVVPAGGAGAAATPSTPGALPPIPGMTAQDRALYTLNPVILVNEIVTRRKEIAQIPLLLNEYKRRQDVLKDRLDTIQKAPIPKHVEELIEKDQEVRLAKAIMTDELIQWHKVKSTSGNTELPAVQQHKHIYEAAKKRYEDLKTEKLKTLEGARKFEEGVKVAAELEKTIGVVQRYEEQLTESKRALAVAEKHYAELPLPAEKNGTTLARFEKEYNPANSQVEVTDGIYRDVMQRYYLTKLEVESPPRITIPYPASSPTQKDAKKQVLGTAFAGVMGFVLMALGVVGYETVSRRVSSLADVKASMPAPVVGVIPGLPNDAAGKDPVRRAAANEAIDKLRAYVSQTWLSRGATTIAVTSPIGDEGKAFAAFGLASSLAQAGYKTLLVDFDLREPAVHAYAGVPNAAGVCELLRAETDVRSVVQFLPNGLHLLPAGKWSDEARKAATGEKLESVLAKLREPYDCVVIHGHALLTVAESVEVARRCEVVLVCAKYRETVTPLLKRAAERVATMEIPYSGVVYIGATEQEALC